MGGLPLPSGVAPVSLSSDTSTLTLGRLARGARKPHNWLQLAKFCGVGGSGYVINLAVFAICVGPLGLHHLAAATLAFCVAVTNNFALNRVWTFGSPDGRRRFQALRFLCVSVAAFLVSAVLLELLVTRLDVAEVLAQAIAIVCATPLSFVGNKLWTFRDR